MEEKWKEFDEAVKPLHDWICKYGHPHITVIVDQAHAEALEGIGSTVLNPPD